MNFNFEGKVAVISGAASGMGLVFSKKFVEQITAMDEDFAKWYTDIVKKADLIDY